MLGNIFGFVGLGLLIGAVIHFLRQMVRLNRLAMVRIEEAHPLSIVLLKHHVGELHLQDNAPKYRQDAECALTDRDSEITELKRQISELRLTNSRRADTCAALKDQVQEQDRQIESYEAAGVKPFPPADVAVSITTETVTDDIPF